MSKLVARFLKDRSGATAIEYGLIVGLIAFACWSAPACWAIQSMTSSLRIAGTYEQLHQVTSTLAQGRPSGRALSVVARTRLHGCLMAAL